MGFASSPTKPSENVALQVARLREDAAEKIREAAKLLTLRRKAEEKMAKELVKRTKCEEEMALYAERASFFEAKAGQSQQMVDKGKMPNEVVLEEAAAHKIKARSLLQKSSALQPKIDAIDERVGELRASIRDYEKRREDLTGEAKRLEAEAIRIQRETLSD